LPCCIAPRWPVTPAIANCLFAAVSTDTGSFRYSSTRPETFRAAAELVECGADLGRIGHHVYDSHPMSRFRLLRHVYRQARMTHDDRIAYFWLRRGDYGRAGAEREESEGLIDHIRSIEPVIVACVFEETEEGKVRVSLRSKSDAVDVNQVAQQFGGGGHRAAAGARLEGTPLAVQRRVLRALRRAIDAAKNHR
jgi:phosphoesterase RecJ-like protein